MEKIWKLIKEEDGMELSDYSIITAMVVSLGIVVYFLRGAISDTMQRLWNMMLY